MKWIPVEECKPIGDCLVYLSEPSFGLYQHTARYRKSGNGVIFGIVGGQFEFDLEGKVTHWKPLGPSPSDEED